ncbi:hypothetical protein ACXC9Q_07865 [Kribbella sp. CWNU-51]
MREGRRGDGAAAGVGGDGGLAECLVDGRLEVAGEEPLQMVLRTYIVQQQPLPTGAGGVASGVGLGMAPAPGLAIKMAIVVIAIVPVLLVYPFIQRHFTKGVIIGAVKG